jgi:GNAT superfamily N-acetyltransferase
MYRVEIIPKENLDSILSLLQILNPKTDREIIMERLSEIKKTGYQCIGVYSDSQLIAISGIWILNKIYAGKHLEPDNVIVHPDFRSRGIGELMLDWIHQYAISIGCLTSELNARIMNEDGNRFWEKMGYEKVGYHFIKKLGGDSKNKKEINSCLDEIKPNQKNSSL